MLAAEPVATVDAVVTTRLHGLVTALKMGVPAVAVDAVRLATRCRDEAAEEVDRLSADFLGLLTARRGTQG